MTPEVLTRLIEIAEARKAGSPPNEDDFVARKLRAHRDEQQKFLDDVDGWADPDVREVMDMVADDVRRIDLALAGFPPNA